MRHNASARSPISAHAPSPIGPATEFRSAPGLFVRAIAQPRFNAIRPRNDRTFLLPTGIMPLSPDNGGS